MSMIGGSITSLDEILTKHTERDDSLHQSALLLEDTCYYTMIMSLPCLFSILALSRGQTVLVKNA
jgi:hypothetical protein